MATVTVWGVVPRDPQQKCKTPGLLVDLDYWEGGQPKVPTNTSSSSESPWSRSDMPITFL